MKPMHLLLLTFVGLFCLMAASCINDDITYDSSARLEFSRDTLSLDTVFTDVGTPTARLIVFNRNKKGVNISSIRFKNPDTRFSLNVDGVSGKTFSDVEIRANDSIYIFVECFIDPNDSDAPVLVEDELEFQLNGNTQQVLVEAWGQDVNRLRNVRVEQDMTLTANRPYVVFDSLTVAPGATLSIEPGTRLLFHDKAKLVVEGKLDARGTPHHPIQMRGDRTGNILTDVSYDIMSGQWTGVRIAPESFDNVMEYVDMRSTTTGLVVDSCGNLDRSKLLLLNSWLHNSQANVLSVRHARVDAVGVCFSEAADAVVDLTGGVYNFLQCTIANNYLFKAISEPLLCLYHLKAKDLETVGNPLMQASFENCIIYGITDDLNEGDLAGTQVFMRYVLLKSNGSNDSNFIECIWGKDPLFYTIREDYIFNYRLRPDSPAIGAGNPAFVTPEAMTDYYGLNRLGAGNPALGAYVFVKPEE